MREDGFSKCHPAALFCYFCTVLGVSMFCMDPLCLGASFLCALFTGLSLGGGRRALSRLRLLAPLALLAALVNFLCSRRGETVLLRLPVVGALTLESLCYGGALGLMLGAVLLWFFSFDLTMTSEKIFCLFGRVLPSSALVLCMALRLVPKFGAQLRSVREAQRSLGRDVDSGGPVRRLKNAVKLLSILMTWALENAVDTAAAMRSRGYGLPGRSSFSVFRFRRRDGILLAWTLFCAACLLAGGLRGDFRWAWYPALAPAPVTGEALALRLLFLALGLTPSALSLGEGLRWEMARRFAHGEGGEAL